MSSYQLDPQYDASKVLYINSKDATTYLEVNAQGTDYLHTNFLYSLTEKLNIAGDQMALLSLYSATIPHSFFNVREGVNDVVPMRLNMIDGNNDAISGQFDLKLDDGNYDTDSLIRQFYYGNVDFQTAEYIGFKEIIIVGTDSGGNGFSNPITDFIKDSDPFTGENPFLSFNQINNCFRFKMEYNDGAPNVVAGDVKVRSLQITFNWGTAPITPTFAGGYDLSGTTNHMANALLGFRGNSDYPTLANQVEPATGNLFYVSETIPPAPLIHTRCVLQSQIVIDLAKESGIKAKYVVDILEPKRKELAKEKPYVVDLFADDGEWAEGEPPMDSPSYYNRPMKTFNRMFPGRCKYMQLDNRQLMYHLRNELCA